MGEVIILPETTKHPITLMGKRAGICWGANIDDDEKNYKRGLDCLESNHGRVMEYVNVELVLSGFSAKVIREWYTHIGGAPTRLQASTRYINYDNFKYVVPKTILANPEALSIYVAQMESDRQAVQKLEALGIPREDATFLLPFGMETIIVDKRNLRNYVDMSHTRECSRAMWEFRDMFQDISAGLSKVSGEWAYIVRNYFMPKCELFGYCTEKKSCHRKPKKGEVA